MAYGCFDKADRLVSDAVIVRYFCFMIKRMAANIMGQPIEKPVNYTIHASFSN